MLNSARSKLLEITGIPDPLLKLRAACAFSITLTADARRIKRMKNMYRNRRAFVIGNGPSLKMTDLDSLKNEITFASNKIHLAFDQTEWRPTYQFLESEFVLKESADLLPSFKHQLMLSTDALQILPRIPGALYYSRDFCNHPHTPMFQKSPLGHVHMGYTVLYSCLQFAYYMGIRTIYLLGVDFNYHLPEKAMLVNALGTKVYTVDSETNYFHSGYKTQGQFLNDPNLAYQEKAYLKAKQVYEGDGRAIYNATRGGKLDIFERVDFDSLF